MAITIEPMQGNFCVVLKTDGTCEVKELDKSSDVFEKSYEFIGCSILEPVPVQSVAPDATLAFLVNENGYSDWKKDPAKVNKIATYLYNGGNAGHFILGNVVFCLIVPGEEGEDFTGMSQLLAKNIAERTSAFLGQADVAIVIPTSIPDPKVKISTFDSIDDLIAYQKGDQSVKPASEKTFSEKES